MRLLNSVCKVIASAYAGVPVHIEEVPKEFQRGCFYVSLTTGSAELKNGNVYQDDPTFQIVFSVSGMRRIRLLLRSCMR